AVQVLACLAELVGSANFKVNASLSTFNWVKRVVNSIAPKLPAPGLNWFLGITPLKEAFSPVRTYEAFTCQDWLLICPTMLPFLTSCTDCTYSASIPNGPQ